MLRRRQRKLLLTEAEALLTSMKPASSDSALPSNPAGDACPHCQHVGRAVSAVTIESLLKPDARARAAHPEGFRFCATRDCPVAYYRPADGLTLAATEVRVPIFQKGAAPDRLVCYCFRHSVREIEEQVRATGTSTVPAAIKAKCAEGLDDCERNNPQGSCCLGNVQRVLKAALAQNDSPDGGAPAPAGADQCCCDKSPATAPDVPGGTPSSRTGGWAVGAVIAAALSSACCWLPLVLVAFGVSAAGVSGFFDAYRPWLLAATAGLLGAGFYFAYFRRTACTPGQVCATPSSRRWSGPRVLLWLAAVITLTLAAFPNYVGRLLARGDTHSPVTLAGRTSMEFSIEGMTCAACAAGLETRLRKLPGVSAAAVDYPRRRAWVAASSATPALQSAIQREVEAAGYRALPAPPTGPPKSSHEIAVH